MTGYYSIQVRITRRDGEWTGTRHLPTFYLHSNVQGILSCEAAERIAVDMIRQALPADDTAEVHASAFFMGA